MPQPVEAPRDRPRAGQGFFPRIESWRGIAALMVASAHAWQSPWRDASGQLRNFYQPAPDVDGVVLAAITPMLRAVNNGGGAVNVFFVISGFVLALSLARGPQHIGVSGRRFLLSRLFRLYPAVIASVVLFGLIAWAAASPYPFSTLLKNAALIDVSVNGVMWSLQLEVIATIVIFGTFVLNKRWGSTAVVTVLVVLAALSFTKTWSTAFGLSLGWLYAFVIGMLAYYWGSRVEWSAQPAVLSAAGFTAALLGMCASRLVLGFGSNWAALIEAVLAGVVAAYLAYGVLGPLGRLFDSAVIRFYGQISYSFYLLHPLTLPILWNNPDRIGSLVQAGWPTAIVAFGLAIVSVAVVTPLAWLSYHAIERPGVALGRAVGRRLMR